MTGLLYNEYFSLFLIIALGLALGKVRVKGISLESSAIIFVALIFGHYGVKIPAMVQQIGLVLFIFTIGIQAGPGFFESFRAKGAQLVLITFIIIASGALLTVVFIYSLDIDPKIAVGLFAGALTSTPGLAAAIESAQSPLASIGYGIAYPFGVIGVILFIRVLPKLLRLNIAKAESDYEKESAAQYPELEARFFIVENQNVHEKTIGELAVLTMTGANISRVMHENEAVVPTSKTLLYKGDIIKAVGSKDALRKISILIGRETAQEISFSGHYDVQWILVTNKAIVNKTIRQLGISQQFNATVTRIRRSGIDITPSPTSQIRFGDKLMVACSVNTMPELVKLFGNNVKRLNETDFLPVAAGIIAGILLGQIRIPLFGLTDFKLGLTGGILIAALILSRLGKTGPIIWNISGPGNQLLRQIGLLFFLASVGTSAGENIAEAVSGYGFTFLFIGISITLIPMMLGVLVGKYMLKINLLTLLGSLAGGMTSTPGLSAMDSMTESNAPHVAYATVYPFALALIILFSQALGML